MKCKYLTLRTKKGTKYYYCKFYKKEVSFSCYKQCDNKIYKQYKTISKRSKMQNKKEKNRFSIFTPNLSKCIKCGTCFGHIDKHEIFPGRNRTNSIKYGFVLPLCNTCHREITNDYEYINKWKVKAQMDFETNIGSKEEFIKIFGMDYRFLYKKNK